MAMSDQYFNGHFNFIKETLLLDFVVMNTDKENKGPMDYTIKILVQEQAHVESGRSYTSRIDFSLRSL
jgi:hypothetical protein